MSVMSHTLSSRPRVGGKKKRLIMSAVLRRLIGYISVEESHGEITIQGFSVKLLMQDFKNIWRTSRISTSMFTHVSRSSVSLPSFFALDLAYTLNQIEAHPTQRTHKRAIRRIRELLFANTWLVQTQQEPESRLDYSQLRQLNLELLDHQMRFLQSYDHRVGQLKLRGYILDAAPGSGKTITSLALALCLKADVTIIVCPKNAVYEVWEKTILNNIKGQHRVAIADRDDELAHDADYYIFHYEALNRAVELSRHLRARRPVLLLDESHNLNLSARISQRTQYYLDLVTHLKTQNALWASGTPLKAMGGEMIPFLRVADPLFTDDVEKRFVKIFGKNSDRANDILNHRLGLLSFKIQKQEYKDDDPIYEDVYVKIPNAEDYTLDALKKAMEEYIQTRLQYYDDHRSEYRARYDALLGEFEKTLNPDSEDWTRYRYYRRAVDQIAKNPNPVELKEEVEFCRKYEDQTIIPKLADEDKKEFRDVRSVVKYPKLKVQGECLGRVVGGLRIACHKDMAKVLDLTHVIDTAAKKTLVFSSYVEVVDTYAATLVEQGYTPLTVHSNNGKSLDSQVKLFQTKLDANPLVTTYSSLSTATPLVEANCVVMLNAPFRDYIYNQAVARADRLGQDTQVYVYNIYLDTGEQPNISTRSKDILAWSRKQVESIMGVSDQDALVSMECFEEANEVLEKQLTDCIQQDQSVHLGLLRNSKKPASMEW